MQAPSKPPTVTAKTERLKCSAAAAGALLLGATICAAATLVFPWWTWTGRPEADFWGVEYKVDAEISILTACTADRGAGRPAGSTCGIIGTMITFVLVSVGVSGGGAVLCLAIATRMNWLCGLLIASLLAGGAGVVEALVLLLAMGLQPLGLDGAAYYFAFGCIFLDASAASLALWGANKATPRAEELIFAEPADQPGRLARTRAAHQAAHELAEALEWRQGARRPSFAPAVEESSDGSAQVSPEGSTSGERRPRRRRRQRVVLQRVIDWGTGDSADVPLPLELLEAAFGEIDRNYSGKITQEEFAEALEDCGLKPSRQAMSRIMADIDENHSGDIDVHEFVGFFWATQELVMMERKDGSRAAIFSSACVFLFFGNLVGWAGVGMSRPAKDDQEAIDQNASLFQMMSGSLVVLFLINVGIPMIRMTLGPSLTAWCAVAAFRIKEFKNRKKRRAEQEERERREAEELSRRADELQRRRSETSPTSQEGAPPPPESEDSPSPPVLGLPAPGDDDPKSPARSSSSPKSARDATSPISRLSSRASGGSAMTAWEEEEEEAGDVPGVYLVLHEGTAVRSGISISSERLRLLKRGEQVRIVEVFEYKRQQRLRGRIEAQEGQPARSWITILSTEDDYRYAERVGPLQVARTSMIRGSTTTAGRPSATAGGASMAGRASTTAGRGLRTQASMRSKASVASRVSKRTSVGSMPEETSGAPPYDPAAYDEARYQASLTRPEVCFIGTSQVRDIRLYLGHHEQFPDERFVRGGATTGRGEWRVGLNIK